MHAVCHILRAIHDLLDQMLPNAAINHTYAEPLAYDIHAELCEWLYTNTAQVTCMPEAIGAMPGKSCSPPYHIHTFQRETFVVHKGTFTFLVDGCQTTLQAGAAPFIVESPVPHSWWNAEPGQEGMLEFSFTPGGKIREFFRTIMGLGQVCYHICNCTSISHSKHLQSCV